MKTIDLNDAMAALSELVDEVMKGGTFQITRHDNPVAALVPIDRTPRLPNGAENFGKFLLSFPGAIEIERD